MGHKKGIKGSTNERECTPLISKGPRTGIQFEWPVGEARGSPSHVPINPEVG